MKNQKIFKLFLKIKNVLLKKQRCKLALTIELLETQQ